MSIVALAPRTRPSSLPLPKTTAMTRSSSSSSPAVCKPKRSRLNFSSSSSSSPGIGRSPSSPYNPEKSVVKTKLATLRTTKDPVPKSRRGINIRNGNIESDKKVLNPIVKTKTTTIATTNVTRKSSLRNKSTGKIDQHEDIHRRSDSPQQHQPDLVKISQGGRRRRGSTSSIVSATSFEITRLESIIDAKSRDVRETQRQLDRMTVGFDAMTVLFNRLSSKADSCHNRQLELRIRSLEQMLNNKDKEIADLKSFKEISSKLFDEELTKYKLDKHSVIEDYNRRFSQIKTQHALTLEKVQRDCNDDIEELKAEHQRALSELSFAHENRYKSMLNQVESDWKSKLSAAENGKADLARQTEQLWKKREEVWEQQKKELTDKINTLFAREDPSAFESPRKNVSKTAIANLQAEVDSLKAVVDMKTDEIRRLRRENVLLEEKLKEFEKIQADLAKTNATLEDLKAQIATKSRVERKLSEENRVLQTSMEREVVEKKRLSMENEELLWKIQQELCGDCFQQSSISSQNPQTMSYIEGMTRKSGGFLDDFGFDEEEASNKLSYSFTEGCSPQPLFLKSKLSRSLSLRERKRGVVPVRTNSFSGHSKTGFVREVVNKGDSVSWKIEYEDSSSSTMSTSSPRQSPTALKYSARKKVIPSTFYVEPLSESTESESSDDSKTKQPNPVNIMTKDLNIDEISSSSEIEIVEQNRLIPSEENSPDEQTLRADAVPKILNTSLPSYDLNLLFSTNVTCKDSAGESLVTFDEEEEQEEESAAAVMTDSLSAISWPDDFEE